MSRTSLHANIPPAELRLWRFDSTIVNFTGASQRLQLFGPGTQLSEFVFIEADLANLDFIGIGLLNVQTFALATTGTRCITQLAPGDSCCWQQQSVVNSGLITTRDGDAAALALVPELDRIDLSLLWGISGPLAVPNTLHITTGARSR